MELQQHEVLENGQRQVIQTILSVNKIFCGILLILRI